MRMFSLKAHAIFPSQGREASSKSVVLCINYVASTTFVARTSNKPTPVPAIRLPRHIPFANGRHETLTTERNARQEER